MTDGADLRQSLERWEAGSWALAAVALAHGPDVPPDRRRAAEEVLAALGLGDGAAAEITPERLAGQAASPLLQTAALLGDSRAAWAAQSDAALLAQGRASGQAGPMFARWLLPALPGLAERLATDGARMLDVGTGVGALAIGYAETFPALRVEGIDVMPRVLDLAAEEIAASTVADRVSVRLESVAALAAVDRYDLAWLPAPFVPQDALRAGTRRVLHALRPGGWLQVGHGKFGDDPVADALNRFKTLAFGGTPITADEAQQLLRDAGFVDVTTVPTPPGAPGLTVGRRPTK